MQRVALVLIVAFALCGCLEAQPKVEIIQHVEFKSYIDCTYRVISGVWLNYPDHLEKQIWVSDLQKHEVEAEKQRQYDVLYPTYLELKEQWKDGIDPCEK